MKRVMIFDLRHPPEFGTSGPDLYRAAIDMCSWADERGFARIGLGEHHQSPDGYIPAPLVFAAAVGAVTRSVRVRISILLAPLYEPLRLAEEVAVTDLCLGGRLDLGLGVGYVKDDFLAFGADYAARGRTLDELLPFLRQAWTGEPFAYRGTTVRVTPRPVQDPMPIYVGGASRAGIERAVRLADGYFPPGLPAGWELYRRLVIEAGRPDPGDFAPRGPIFLWVTKEPKDKVWERLAPHVRHQIDSYAAWTNAAYRTPSGPFVPPDAYQVMTPDEVLSVCEQLGPDGELTFNPLLAGIDPAEAWDMLELVDREVLPHLR